MATPTIDFFLEGTAAGYKASGKEIRQWGKRTEEELMFELARLGVKDLTEISSKIKYNQLSGKTVQAVKEDRLKETVKSGVKKRGPVIEQAWISFARHGIFLQHGVGKYRPIGSRDANYAAKPWLTNVLPNAVEALAIALSEYYADIISGELRLRIPGVIDTQVKVGN